MPWKEGNRPPPTQIQTYCTARLVVPKSSSSSAEFLFVRCCLVDGRHQTTKGIWISKAVGIEPFTVVLDLEGTDGRERGQVKLYLQKCSRAEFYFFFVPFYPFFLFPCAIDGVDVRYSIACSCVPCTLPADGSPNFKQLDSYVVLLAFNLRRKWLRLVVTS